MAPLRRCVPVALMGMLWLGCSSGGGSPASSGGTNGNGSGGSGSGGTTSASGGSSGSGGATSSGGKTGSGGAPASSGGATGSGGATASGGKTGSGGATASGGSPASGGTTGSGGTGTASGGAGSHAPGSGGSSAGGASGTGGAGGGTAATPVTPTMSGTTYSFNSGDIVFQIDASTGGRVSKLSLSGTDIIMPTATDPTTWGSVFWTSPRSDWPGTMWPPPANIDSAAYTAMIAGNHVTAMGMVEPTLMVSMSKDYAMDSSGLITLSYKINAQKALKAAPWEISRVPRGGLAFFPVTSSSSVTKGPWTVTTMDNVVWIDDAAKTATSPNGDKLIADGAEGWEAYVIGGNMFLKLYTDTPSSMFAPMEGEIGVYPGAGFVEFEVQGAYTSIAAGSSLPYTTHWKVLKLPSNVTVSAGSASLLSFARQQATL